MQVAAVSGSMCDSGVRRPRLKVSPWGPQIGENGGFSPRKFLGGTYEHSIGHNQFNNILRHVVKLTFFHKAIS